MAATNSGSNTDHHHGHGHDGHSHDAHEGAHGGPKLYWVFAVILCLLTFCEWSIFKYRDQLGSASIMVPALLGLSAIKFVMVVGWYMHLRYDPGWMKKIFVASLVLGGGTALILVTLLGKARVEAAGHPDAPAEAEHKQVPDATPAAPAPSP